jgi:hypothetical protein
MFKIVRSRLTTITDRHVTVSIHHLRVRTGISNMLATNMLVTNIPKTARLIKPLRGGSCARAPGELALDRFESPGEVGQRAGVPAG